MEGSKEQLRIVRRFTLPSVILTLMVATLQGCGGGSTETPVEVIAQELAMTPMASLSSIGMQTTMTTAAGFSSFGQTPAAIRTRYGFDPLTTPAQQGSGQIIVVITAFNNPNAAADLAKFSAQHGLAACPAVPTKVSMQADGYYGADVPKPAAGDGCTFQIVNASAIGRVSNTRPETDGTGRWTAESTMDIEWAHATAPMAKIVLVQAPNNMFSSLVGAGRYASTIADVVSMSWGAKESLLSQGPCSAAELRTYSACTTTWKTENWLYGPANPVLPNGVIDHTAGGMDTQAFSNPNVTYVAASGDWGAAPIWPSVSSKVLAVGGTRDVGTIDTGWAFSGGGTSIYYPAPSWQTVSGSTRRTTPDVAMAADSATPVSVYITPQKGMPDTSCVAAKGAANCGWYAGYGTSVSAPMWAGLAAITNAVRMQNGKAKTDFIAGLYGIASVPGNYVTAFSDVVSGNNGYTAKAGYDMVTGLGVPRAASLVAMLAAQ